MIPFPAARRVDLVASITRRALELSPEAGEKHIQRSLDRKGLGEDLIARDVAALSAAIRAVIRHAVMSRKEG